MAKTLWYYKLAILWAFFFTLQSVGSVMLAALTNVDWSAMDSQARFLLVLGMMVNWAGMMMAFLSRVVHRLAEDKPIMENGDTTIATKPEVKI